MRLAQNVETVGSSSRGQSSQFFLIEGGHNQQNGIGPVSSRFHNLDLIDDEILAQTRKGAVGRGLAQIVERALKELFVGQHREGGGARLLQIGRQSGGSEVSADQAFRRRGFFQFGNNRDTVS